MKKPKYLNLFLDNLDELELLSDAQTGRLIKALMRYANGGEAPGFGDDIALRVLFSILKKQTDRAFDNYTELTEKRSAAAKKAAAARYQKQTSDNETDAIASDCCEDKDKDEDKDEDKEKEKDNNEEKQQAGKPEGREDPTFFLMQATEIVEHLNQAAGTHYRASSSATRKLLCGLLRDGYSVGQIKSVVDSKCAEWLNSEFSRYLRPDVLFGKKFESYLNAPKPQKSLPQSRFHPWQNETQDGFLDNLRLYEENYEVPTVSART